MSDQTQDLPQQATAAPDAPANEPKAGESPADAVQPIGEAEPPAPKADADEVSAAIDGSAGPAAPEPTTPDAPASVAQADGSDGDAAPEAPSPAADELATPGPVAPEPTAQATPDADPAPAADAPSSDDQPADEGAKGETSFVAASDTSPIFGGKSDPSPEPDLGDEQPLPHPALSGHNPGFIPGATETTQSALPVPGEAGLAAVAAQLIGDAGHGPAAPAPAPQGAPASDTQGSSEPLDAPAAPEAGSEAAPNGDAEADAPATPAVPTAAHAPLAFEELNDDGAAALDGIDETEAEVLRLELRGLANLALALVKRLEKLGEKTAVGEHLEQVQASAQGVVSQALNMFDTEEDDLGAFESASAELVLDSLGEE